MDLSTYEIILLLTFSIFILLPKKENVLIGWGYFLTFTVLFELIITFYWAKVFGNNFIPYNFFALCCAFYYIYISYRKIKSKKIGYLFSIISICYALFSAIIFIYNIENRRTINIVYVIGLIIALIMMLIYYKEIVESKDFKDITKMPYFYFSLGILIFFVSNFSILCFLNVLVSNDKGNNAFSNILKVGNISLYLGYLFTTLCCIKKPRFIGSY